MWKKKSMDFSFIIDLQNEQLINLFVYLISP